MNSKHLIFPFLFSLFIVRCVPISEEKTKKDETPVVFNNIKVVKYKADVSISEVEWNAATTRAHRGSIELKEGFLLVDSTSIVSGSLILNMRSIDNADLLDKSANKRLVAQLKSRDFFCVDSFPVAKLEISEVSKEPNSDLHIITGKLTIKNVTRPIAMKANVKMDKFGITIESKPLLINTTAWGINKSDTVLNDYRLKDEIALKLKLLVKK